MVELKVKVGDKGQILIPKILREKYGINRDETVTIEPTSEGLLIRGRPSPEEIISRLNSHVEKVRTLKTEELKLGDLKKIYLEMEFEEKRA